jgi:HAMP domain-containing protein
MGNIYFSPASTLSINGESINAYDLIRPMGQPDEGRVGLLETANVLRMTEIEELKKKINAVLEDNIELRSKIETLKIWQQV